METKFQTSFIPKKPTVSVGGAAPQQKHHGTTLFMSIGVFLFIASLAVAGGAFAWKSYLVSQQDVLKKQLADKEKLFRINDITDLKRTNTRIDTASALLKKHLAISQVFDIIPHFTVTSVRFNTLDISQDGTVPNSPIKIDMGGYGTSRSVLAFQSDVLGHLEEYALRKVVKNPVMIDPALDAVGNVTFKFSATIDPDTLSYTRSVSGEAPSDDNIGVTPSPSATPKP